MSKLVIYALRVGKGTLAISPMPGHGGDYDADLKLIAAWKPGLVISMCTEVEMIQDGARHFGTDIQGCASRWAHLPVEDFGAPSQEILARWPAVSNAARHALTGGGRVLIHCRGGCGRSGMAALRLMIENGEGCSDALERLRAVRSCAIETDDQRDWAFQGKRKSGGA